MLASMQDIGSPCALQVYWTNQGCPKEVFLPWAPKLRACESLIADLLNKPRMLALKRFAATSPQITPMDVSLIRNWPPSWSAQTFLLLTGSQWTEAEEYKAVVATMKKFLRSCHSEQSIVSSFLAMWTAMMFLWQIIAKPCECRSFACPVSYIVFKF